MTRNNIESIEILLKQDADINTKTKNGQTPLHMAADIENNADCVKLLHLAASKENNNETLKVLLENRADISAADNDVRTALHHAVAGQALPNDSE